MHRGGCAQPRPAKRSGGEIPTSYHSPIIILATILALIFSNNFNVLTFSEEWWHLASPALQS